MLCTTFQHAGFVNYAYNDPDHVHAVTGTQGWWFSYDGNGNQISRNPGSAADFLDWGAQNRLVEYDAADGTETSMVYDAEGARIVRVEEVAGSETITTYLNLQDGVAFDPVESARSLWAPVPIDLMDSIQSATSAAQILAWTGLAICAVATAGSCGALVVTFTIARGLNGAATAAQAVRYCTGGNEDKCAANALTLLTGGFYTRAGGIVGDGDLGPIVAAEFMAMASDIVGGSWTTAAALDATKVRQQRFLVLAAALPISHCEVFLVVGRDRCSVRSWSGPAANRLPARGEARLEEQAA